MERVDCPIRGNGIMQSERANFLHPRNELSLNGESGLPNSRERNAIRESEFFKSKERTAIWWNGFRNLIYYGLLRKLAFQLTWAETSSEFFFFIVCCSLFIRLPVWLWNFQISIFSKTTKLIQWRVVSVLKDIVKIRWSLLKTFFCIYV